MLQTRSVTNTHKLFTYLSMYVILIVQHEIMWLKMVMIIIFFLNFQLMLLDPEITVEAPDRKQRPPQQNLKDHF